jgi:hypothetical protein
LYTLLGVVHMVNRRHRPGEVADRPGAGPPVTVTVAGPSASVAVALAAGASAGPLFVVSSVVQGVLRPGFSFTDHPPSALALGGAGWIQMATLVVAGCLLVGGAWAMHRAMSGPASRWAPRLIAVFGCALVAAGVFRMDPAFGFPPGTPAGMADGVSWHAAVHGVLFPLGFGAIIAGCLVMARRFGQQHRRGLQWYCLATAPVSLALSMWPNLAVRPDGRFLPMWIGVVVAFAWTSVVIADVRREFLSRAAR